MALAKGHSKIRCGPLSDRTKTAIFVVKHLTNVCWILKKYLYKNIQLFLLKVKFQITEIPFNSTIIIECDGLGYQRQF
jgi:hypothetical protein